MKEAQEREQAQCRLAGGDLFWRTTPWRDQDLGNKMLAKMAERGPADSDVAGDVWTMRLGEFGRRVVILGLGACLTSAHRSRYYD